MKVDININVNLEELKEILTRTDELRQFVVSSIEDLRNWVQDIQEYGQDYGTPAINKSEPSTGPTPTEESEPSTGPTPTEESAPTDGETAPAETTLEMVRAKLASLMQSGKQSEVKELLKRHGGERLSDIPKDNYQALLKEAGEL